MEKLDKLKDFSSLKVSLASPARIKSWSYGEVLKPETINYRTFKPEKDGLFCERIFGPTKDFECYCGKYKRIRYKGVICDKCGVEVTRKRVRRERMGHIKLATSCVHAWFFRGIPSKIAIVLDVSPRDIDSVIYYSKYMVVEVNYVEKVKIIATLEREYEKKQIELGDEEQKKIKEIENKAAGYIKGLRIKDKTQGYLAKEEVLLKSRQEIVRLREQKVLGLERLAATYKTLIDKLESIDVKSLLSEEEYKLYQEYPERFCTLKMGGEAIRRVLEDINLDELSSNLKKKISKSKGQQRVRLTKRLRVVEGFRKNKIRPEWLVLELLPIIPPELRPMVQLEGGRFATSDLNDLYRAVINRNNRLKRLLDLGAPEIIIRNEKRMLQEAVDNLIDSSKAQRYKTKRGKLPLRSLSDMLKGKQGRFRQNLLGKRVDYSGRGVIVVGPQLRMQETGLPKEMALEIFKPFVLREILFAGLAPNVKSAKYFLEGRSREVWDALERVVKDRLVLLNRAPTLHRLGIVAFYPKLIEGNAIQIHPCVCAGFNADFDGDQMAVHAPLSKSALKETEEVMLSSKNLLKPAEGEPIAVPNKEMVLGTYYLTSVDEEKEGYKGTFCSEEEVFLALNNKVIKLRQRIKIQIKGQLVETTAGRVVFNQILPDSLSFYNGVVEKKKVKELISLSLSKEGRERTVRLIDDIKDLGFKYATISGISVSIMDCKVSPEMGEIIAEAEKKAEEINRNFRRGLLTKEEERRLTEELWAETTNILDKATWEQLEKSNSVRMIIEAGASRASRDQVKQLGGMKGLIVDPTGKVVELPIKSNFRYGLTGLEYFAGTRGARKGLADTALRTADSGYLTRRLVDVAQDIIVRKEDCGTQEGFEISRGRRAVFTSFADKVFGRIAAEDIKIGRKILIKKGRMILREQAAEIDKSGVKLVKVRSPLCCEAEYGICSMCYGLDLGREEQVQIGNPVGVIAAQSIGEPGTQLTLRTFHMGGILGKDITQGLPRVEQLFEARMPKFQAIMAEISGRVKIREADGKRFITIKATQRNAEIPQVEYEVPPTLEIIHEDGEIVGAGTPLTEGHLDLKGVLTSLGVRATQRYIIDEIQGVYSSQGVTLNDKHIEVIVRQMFSRVQVESSGDTPLLPGDIVSVYKWREENEKILAEEGEPATAEIIILGVTKAALKTDSFLSSASFQETTRVLTDAACSGRVDRLLGLKENVIIGRLIPVGERARIE